MKEKSKYNNMIGDGNDPDKDDLREHFEHLQSDEYDKYSSIFVEEYDNYEIFGPVHTEREVNERITIVENQLKGKHPNKLALMEYLKSLKESKERFKNIN